ncbi:MAG TPA: helix-turn-helix transcriptional regulator [Steroidobacteraceae bacterium]|nr:helix-turn-helix transcriptional regulator [Steroidobacteraceae bacterium]
MSKLDHTMPVPRWDTALRITPGLDALAVQAERIRDNRPPTERPNDGSMVVLTHAGYLGGKTLPRQEVICTARLGAICPHTERVSKNARPLSYRKRAQEIGARIQWVRELVEPNRSAFARTMGVDRAILRDMESGRRPPSIYAVTDLAHRLKVSTDYILTGSLRGVDGELAAKLASLHPELLSSSNPESGHSSDNSGRGGGPNKLPQPTKPVRSPALA